MGVAEGPHPLSTAMRGRVAIVSGVGPGLGRECVLTLVAAGADIGMGTRREESLTALAAEVAARGSDPVTRPTDITSPEQCQALVDDVMDRFGRVDVLVNNAFTSRPWSLFEEGDLDHWRDAMEVNYFGTLNMTKAVVPAMKVSGGGAVVMVNTMYDRIAVPRYGPYAGSKGALESVTRVLARELGPAGIRVNGIHPGPMDSARLRGLIDELAAQRSTTAATVLAEFTDRTCLGALPTSREVAGTALYLASDLSRGVTGQSVHVNGGAFLG